MTVLLIDNYDSFTFNLAHALGMAGAEVAVHRNDAIMVAEALAMKPEAIVLSPGPCTPNEAGICLDLIREAAPIIPILGVCLGHQAIGQAFGGKIVRILPVHGKTSLIEHNARGLFHGLNRSVWATRYHSLIVDAASLPPALDVTARTRDGLIMGFSHKEYCVHGVQFHPESIATEQGALLLRNFLKLARGERGEKAPERSTSPEPPPVKTEMKPFIVKAASGEPLSQAEARAAFEIIMQSGATPAQISGFLTALAMRGETAEELAGAVEIVRAKCVPVKAPLGAIDIVGTGGDASNSLNISTAAALVAAACGVPVAKHGNRSVSSRSGAADVLEALDVAIGLLPEHIARCIRETNFGFMFAPKHHEAILQVVPVRRELGIPTLFNLMGPLANPAGVRRAVIGVNHRRWLEPFARVFGLLGGEHAWIVHGSDGLDEITISGPTEVIEWHAGKMNAFTVTPEDAGLKRSASDSLKGADAATNASRLRRLLKGEQSPYRDAVAMNAGAGLVVAGKTKDFREGVQLAIKAIDGGAAAACLEKLVRVSNS